MKKKTHTHLTQFERDRIEALQKAGEKQESIAKILNRPPSTISREIKRNALKKDGKYKNKGEYSSTVAQKKSHTRRRFAKYQGKKINDNKDLKKYIIKRIKLKWSPDIIAGRMKLEQKDFYANKNAIYEWLYSPWGQKYTKYLKSKQFRKKKRKKNKTKKTLIPNRIGIEKRPAVINDNNTYGHAEGDTIVSGKKTRSKTALAVVYQRKSKFVSIRRIESLRPIHFKKAVLNIQNQQIVKSLTMDNGIENRLHQEFNLTTFFCDPYSSWQKPGVENVNSIIRRYIPKGSNISKFSHHFIKKIENTINATPRKSIGYKTPKEVMIEQKLLL